MPKVTLKNGQEVELPQEYYDELKGYADAFGDGMTVDRWYQSLVDLLGNSLTKDEFFKRIATTPGDDDPVH